jgi:hypothetical protein
MTDYIKKMLSSSGEASSSRVGFILCIIAGIALATYDTLHNGHLEINVLIAILTAGSGGYVAGKHIDSKGDNNAPIS